MIQTTAMFERRLLAGLLCLGAATSAVAQQSSGQVFTCKGPSGRTLTSDRLIGECMDREQRVLARDGTLLRIVPPSLTAEERAEKDARDQRAAAEARAKVDAVTRDRNLVQRYPNGAAHQKVRDAALADLRTSMQLSETRQAELRAERKPLLDEVEFYKGNAFPAKLRQQLDANDAAAAAQRDAQKNQAAELARVTALFDTELARLKRLWAGAAPGSIGLAAADEAASAAAARPAVKSATKAPAARPQ